MARRYLALGAAILSAGCGKLLGIDDLSGPATPVADAPVTADARAVDAATPVDTVPDAAVVPDGAPVPAMINVSGQVRVTGSNLCANHEVRLVRDNDVELARTTTDATCKFQFSTATGGAPLDVHLDLPASPVQAERASRTYFAAPLRADRVITAIVYTDDELNRISLLANDPLAPVEALVVIQVHDADGTPVVGAEVKLGDASNARIHYSDGMGPLPLGSSSSTRADGIAFAFGGLPGPASAEASKPGIPFPSREIFLESGGVALVELAP